MQLQLKEFRLFYALAVWYSHRHNCLYLWRKR